MSTSKPYFIVASERRGSAPFPAQHDNANKAVQEAMRLARLNRGEKFFVFRSHCVVVASDVTITSLSPEFDFDDQIPF